MCLSPKYITNRSLHYDLFQQLRLPVACGKCEECKQQNRSEWFTRCFFEWKKNDCKNTYFYTLTYNKENLPLWNGIQHFSKRHLQLFMKRLRKLLNPLGITIRYLFSCEFGELRGRCHYHALFFLSKEINPYWFYRLVEKAWSYGFVKYGDNVGLVNSVNGIQYVTKYITKDYSHLDVMLPRLAPLVFKRYYKLFVYCCQRSFLNIPATIVMNDDFTFSMKKFDKLSPELDEFVRKFLTKMRRIVNELTPFHLQSTKLGSSMVECCIKELDVIPIQTSNGSVYYSQLPRYIKRLLWYDVVESETSGKKTRFVLSEDGKKHKFELLQRQVECDVENLRCALISASSLDNSIIPYLKKEYDMRFNSVYDVVHYCQHFDLDLEVLSIYKNVFRGRVCTFGDVEFNAQFVKDFWQDYASACIFDCSHFDYGKICEDTHLVKVFTGSLFDNHPYFHVYEQAVQLLDAITLYYRKNIALRKLEKEKNVRKLRQIINPNV